MEWRFWALGQLSWYVLVVTIRQHHPIDQARQTRKSRSVQPPQGRFGPDEHSFRLLSSRSCSTIGAYIITNAILGALYYDYSIMGPC